MEKGNKGVLYLQFPYAERSRLERQELRNASIKKATHGNRRKRVEEAEGGVQKSRVEIVVGELERRRRNQVEKGKRERARSGKLEKLREVITLVVMW
ncbi:hypothetical protein VNO77_23148 [Canavalia gladiata]|uniref:Uncharacterized protein n=1 Tax=Canavalia gladiata TaxID=3824 RepID=A0AAN9L7C3_CANGL